VNRLIGNITGLVIIDRDVRQLVRLALSFWKEEDKELFVSLPFLFLKAGFLNSSAAKTNKMGGWGGTST
jgi:hypothetical protein